MFDVDIPFLNGKIREMKHSDIADLTSMCQDPVIQNLYFCEIPISWGLYWNRVLDVNLSERFNEFSNVRNIGKAFGVHPSKRLEYHLVIEYYDTPAGLLALNVSDYDNPYVDMFTSSKNAIGVEMSSFVSKKYRKNGLSTSAFKAAIPYIFDEIGAEVIIGVALKENLASRCMVSKLGFKEVWVGKSFREQYSADVVVMALYNPSMK